MAPPMKQRIPAHLLENSAEPGAEVFTPGGAGSGLPISLFPVDNPEDLDGLPLVVEAHAVVPEA
jgi:hypothetical protein